MRQLIDKNRYFLIPFAFFLLICVVLLLTHSKAELHILSNKINTPFLDYFFKYITYLGDGTLIAIVFIALLFIKYRYAFAFLTGSLATSLVVNILKKLVFIDMYRPSKYFEMFESYQLHVVEGIKLHVLQSFPSGHTATAFNLFFMMALLVKSNILKLFFFIIAVLVAYSRVYLSQHFLQDIAAGAFLGVGFIMISWIWFDKINKNWLDNSFLNRLK